MTGAVYSTALDIAVTYWSMPLKEKERKKTAFSVPRVKFVFNVTPYGLCNIIVSYEQLLDVCLSGLPTEPALAYMDNITIFSRIFREYFGDIEVEFRGLHQAKAIEMCVCKSKGRILGIPVTRGW